MILCSWLFHAILGAANSCQHHSFAAGAPLSLDHWTTASPGSCDQQQADTVCIGMLQMLKLRSREASAIVKFVFLILLDLAGQFVDFVSFDGGVEQGEGTFWPLPPNLLYAKPKHSALDPIWHQRFCRDKICA